MKLSSGIRATTEAYELVSDANESFNIAFKLPEQFNPPTIAAFCSGGFPIVLGATEEVIRLQIGILLAVC